jgi:hypothetical protein
MTRLTIAAVATLIATGASAQMAPSWQPNAETCRMQQYSNTVECRNFLEGRSSSPTTPNINTIDQGNHGRQGPEGERSGGGDRGGGGGGHK